MTNQHCNIANKHQSLAWQAVRALTVGFIGMREYTPGEKRRPCDG